MIDRSAVLDGIREELDTRGFFKRNSCACRVRDKKVLILTRNGCELIIRLGGRAGRLRPDVHLYDGKVHDQRFFDFDWSSGLTSMQICEIVNYCEELVPKWQGNMKFGSSRQIRIKQSRVDKEQEKMSRRNEVQNHWNLFRNNEDESALRKVLSANPFTQEIVDGWGALLHKSGDGRFVLPSDEKILQKITASEAHVNYQIRLNLLPKPFAGNPRGDIWLLLYNPGYMPIDEFDTVSVADKGDVFEEVCNTILSEIRNADERKRREQSYRRLDPSVLFVDRSPKEDVECLRRRQELMLNQLLLKIDNDLPFFWFDESFRTAKVKAFGQKLVGGHLWWKAKLNGFLRDGNDVGRIFVMEYFPYHSRNFKHNHLREWVRESDYHKFWRTMIEYGRKHGKKIIVRNRWMVDDSVDDRVLDCGEYFEFVSTNCSLSLDNIKIGS